MGIRIHPPQPRACKRCEKSFVPYWRGPRFYCSKACRVAGPRLVKMDAFTRVYPPRCCEYEGCQQEFQPTNARQVYCTKECYHAASRERDRISAKRLRMAKSLRRLAG